MTDTELATLRMAIIDLLAILDSPHTSVSVKWETGQQYAQAKALLAKLVKEISQ